MRAVSIILIIITSGALISYSIEPTPSPLISMPMEYNIEADRIPENILTERDNSDKKSGISFEKYTTHLNAPGDYKIDLTAMGSINNDGVILRNTGAFDIIDPWLVLNNKRDWYNVDTMLREILGSEADPKKRAFLIWQFITRNIYHWHPAENGSEVHSPIKFINVYGYGLCDDSAVNSEALYKRAGFSQARTWSLQGHVVPEVYYNSAWHMLDPDLQVFYPTTDTMHIAGVEDCASNSWFVERVSGSAIAELYTSTSNNSTSQNRWSISHTMSMTLRPGEQLERYWYNWGKYHDNCYHKEPSQYGNGRVLYEPDLNSTIFKNGFQTIQNIECFAESKIRPRIHLNDPGQNGILICRIFSPYVFVGGAVKMNYYCKSTKDHITLGFSKNRGTWHTLQTCTGPSSGTLEVNIDNHIAPVSSDACYVFWIRITLGGSGKDSVGIDQITFCGDIQCAPNALPALEPAIVNSSDIQFTSQPGASLEITHIYHKISSIHPPESPGGSIFPEDNDIIYTTAPTLLWEEAPTSGIITQNEIMVSWGPLGILPITPLSLETINHATSWTVPEGWLLEGQTYYWNVRSKDNLGNWSPWGGPWKFTIGEPAPDIHN